MAFAQIVEIKLIFAIQQICIWEHYDIIIQEAVYLVSIELMIYPEERYKLLKSKKIDCQIENFVE